MDDKVRNIGVRGDDDLHHVAEVNGWASKIESGSVIIGGGHTV